MRRLSRPLLILLAIIFLIEAWLWSRLEPIVEAIVRRIPLRAVKAWIAGTVRKLPPAATLIVFVVPALILFPLKIAGFWLLAQKQWIAASAVLLLAKLAGLGVTAFVFELTRPKLLQMAWFRKLYHGVLAVLAWARAMVAPIEFRIKKLLWLCSPKHAGHALRLFWRVRRRMRRTQEAKPAPFSADAVRGAQTAPAP